MLYYPIGGVNSRGYNLAHPGRLDVSAVIGGEDRLDPQDTFSRYRGCNGDCTEPWGIVEDSRKGPRNPVEECPPENQTRPM